MQLTKKVGTSKRSSGKFNQAAEQSEFAAERQLPDVDWSKIRLGLIRARNGERLENKWRNDFYFLDDFMTVF